MVGGPGITFATSTVHHSGSGLSIGLRQMRFTASCCSYWNSSFALGILDVTTDSALSEGLTVAYRNDPRLGAVP